jgi:hypothetical protein
VIHDYSGAFGDYSDAFGDYSGASGDYSGVFGDDSDAFGDYSDAFDDYTDAFGDYSGVQICRSNVRMLDIRSQSARHGRGTIAFVRRETVCPPPPDKEDFFVPSVSLWFSSRKLSRQCPTVTSSPTGR